MLVVKKKRKKFNRKNFLLYRKKKFRRVLYKDKYYLNSFFCTSSNFSVISLNNFRLYSNQLSVFLLKLRRMLKNSFLTHYFLPVFNKAITCKSKQARMGKGKAKIVDVISKVSFFSPLLEFKFFDRTSRIRLKRRRVLFKSRVINMGSLFGFFFYNTFFFFFHKVFRRRRRTMKSMRRRRFFFVLFFVFFHGFFYFDFVFLFFNFLNNVFFFRDLFFIYNRIRYRYYNFDLNSFFSVNKTFIFCNMLLRMFFKSKFNEPISIYPFKYDLISNGRNRNQEFGRR